ncbi:MAG: hypothetical protein KKH77_03020 [Candidatus Omnitrophica bacterium]|nr:hypothetical protein [Candidatus Omnitrophota bacterium]MBU0881483.1 hypothetical protein [Candidatus Omnitrophota bacterium]MBU1808387.1 hypothetical protein [Candidatus Omnitrophota bacterium]
MKKMVKNTFGEYESNDLWFRRLPGISHYYFGKIKKILCSWIENKEGVALDFGCGQQRLKDFLPRGMKYVGYDIIPEYTDVKDFKKTNPGLFFSVSSFEHVTHEELDDILKWICSSNIKQVFVDLPIRNDRYLLWALMGFKKRVIQEHHLDTIPYDLQDMHNRIAKYLKLHRECVYHNHALTEWRKK